MNDEKKSIPVFNFQVLLGIYIRIRIIIVKSNVQILLLLLFISCACDAHPTHRWSLSHAARDTRKPFISNEVYINFVSAYLCMWCVVCCMFMRKP